MRIGIAAPCPKPYVSGGAERLWRGLRDYINNETTHQADIIKLPVGEGTFWELIAGYRDFSALDLTGFDVLISGKYPAWMVDHPCHVIYMVHPCRGLYDGYRGPAFEPALLDGSAPWLALREILERREGDRSALAELFEVIDALHAQRDSAERMVWPGPITREIVRFLDRIALQPGRIRKYRAISGQLLARPDYFPLGANVVVAYPPSPLQVQEGPSGDYIFSASRLADYKRMDLLVQAMQHVRGPLRLRIAGEGAEFDRLVQLASPDPRIELLGHRTDTEIVALYQNSLAVAFVPYQEDYGYVALEAMAAAKPVVTVHDAGGPTELVRDGVTGLVVEPHPKRVGAAFERLAADPQFAQRLGLAGKEFASGINWRAVLKALLPDDGEAHEFRPIFGQRGLPKLVVTTTFSIFPPRHGGQARVFQLYRHLTRWFDIVIVTPVAASGQAQDREVAPGLREVRVPKSRAHQRQEQKLRVELGIPIEDISMLAFPDATPAFAERLRAECSDAVAAVACHPYCFPLLKAVAACPLWYEAQDVEAEIKASLLPKNQAGRFWVQKVRDAEQELCDRAEVILACSEADARSLARLYHVAPGKLHVAPNGTDLSTFDYRAPAERRQLRRSLLADSAATPMMLFMGSGHQPNIEAAQQVFTLATQCPSWLFLVLGNCCYAFDPLVQLPDNVYLLGELSETERLVVLEMADIALNPILAGSGTNLKMIDYLAAGLPTLTTPVGARGLDLIAEEHCVIANLKDFAPSLRRLMGNHALRETLSRNGRRLVAKRFGWSGIALDVLRALPERYRVAKQD